MDKKLSWVKEAFGRDSIITQDGQIVGQIHQNAFSPDVEAQLNQVHLRFDVTGFLVHSVTIHDLNADGQVIGQIDLSFGKRAELVLLSGERYHWKRQDVLMREWGMIRETPDGMPEKEIVNYDLTRRFFQDAGDIMATDVGPTNDIVILAGLFIRNYFQRRRRVAAAIS